MLDTFLSSTAPGQARLLLSRRVPEALAAVEAWAEASDPTVRVVTLTADPVPDIRRLLAGAIETVAEVTLRLWPRWYDRHGVRNVSSEGDPTARAGPGVSKPWLRRAAVQAAAGRRPLPRGFPRRTSLRQLAIACRAPGLLLVLATEDAAAPPARLAGLARGAEWLAREADARVVVVVPHSYADAKALEPIAYRRLVWEPTRDTRAPAAEEKEGVRVWPIVGQPHPFSPGEQHLAKALAKDDELGPLFAFNQRVRTERGSDFVVDLLWPKGRVAIEVDGYAHHSNRYAFARDRQRDYELLISGYLVLRVPHDEVVEDVGLTLEKIRDVVAHRRTMSKDHGDNVDV